jgi:NAD(P)-dependent dehydrogenase (short-subunit alcohol dehydrogenase family)
MNTFTDQIAVITGASSGIGKAIALGLAQQGATVCLIGRNPERLKTVIEITRAVAPKSRWYQADLTIEGDVREVARRIGQDFESVDILIHSAGFIALDRIETASLQDFDRHYLINVRAPYLLTQTLLRLLKVRRGQIVFINSSAGLNAKANAGQYAASKNALKAIADSLREEVNADGLRVLSVYPGRIATPMQAAIYQMEGKVYHPERLMQPEDVAVVVINALSLPRTAELTEIHIRPLIKPD